MVQSSQNYALEKFSVTSPFGVLVFFFNRDQIDFYYIFQHKPLFLFFSFLTCAPRASSSAMVNEGNFADKSEATAKDLGMRNSLGGTTWQSVVPVGLLQNIICALKKGEETGQAPLMALRASCSAPRHKPFCTGAFWCP